MAEHLSHRAFRVEASRLGYLVRYSRITRVPYIHVSTMGDLLAFIRATTLDLRWYNGADAGYDVYPPEGID